MSYLFFFYFIHFFFFWKNEIKVGEVRRRARVNQRPEILGPGPFGFTCEGRNTRTRTKYFFFFFFLNIFLLRIPSDTSVGFLLEMNVKVQRFLFNGFNDFI